MKNSKTMYELAKAKAIAKGPRKFRKLAGFALTESELKHLYLTEGYSPARKVWERNAALWEEIGWVKAYNVGINDEKVYYFILDPEELDSASYKIRISTSFPDMNESEFQGIVIG